MNKYYSVPLVVIAQLTVLYVELPQENSKTDHQKAYSRQQHHGFRAVSVAVVNPWKSSVGSTDRGRITVFNRPTFTYI